MLWVVHSHAFWEWIFIWSFLIRRPLFQARLFIGIQCTEHPWRLVDWTTNSQIFMMQFYEMVLAKCCTCSHEQIALTLFSEFSRRCVGCHRNPRSSPIIAASETSASFLPPTASASLSLSLSLSLCPYLRGGCGVWRRDRMRMRSGQWLETAHSVSAWEHDVRQIQVWAL